MSGTANLGSQPGNQQAILTRVAGGLPDFKRVATGDLDPGILAAWSPSEPGYESGAVLLNVEHPVLAAEIDYWQSQYPEHHAEAILDDVIQVYGEMAVAKVAHSASLNAPGLLSATEIDEKLRSDGALTMALLGLMGEEALLSTRIGGKYGRRRTRTA